MSSENLQKKFVKIRKFKYTIFWIFRLTWSTSAWLTAGTIGTTLISGLIPAVLALIARGLINALVVVLDSGSLDNGPVLLWLILGAVFSIVQVLTIGANTFFKQLLQDKLKFRVSLNIMKHASTLDLAFFENPSYQDMLTRVQRNATNIVPNFLDDGLKIITNLLQIISLTIILLVIEPLITLVLLFFIVPFFLFQWHLSKMRYELEYNRTTKRRWSSYFANIMTSEKSVPEVKLLQLSGLFIEKFRGFMLDFLAQDRRVYLRIFIGNTLFTILAIVGFYALFVRIVNQVLSGALTLGDVAIYSGATSQLRTSLQNTVGLIGKTRENMLYLFDLQDFLQTKPQQKTSGIPINSKRSVIEFKDVSFTYPGSTKPVLSQLSFRLEPGETVALVGKNGAGKTT